MLKALISIQEGQFSDEQILRLEAILKRHYADQVSGARLHVIWGVIGRGQGYTNYQASQSSLVTLPCPNGFAQHKRVHLLSGIAHEWCSETGQNLDHLMLSLLDADQFQRVLESNQQRLSKRGRIIMAWHILRSLAHAKMTRGFLSFNASI